MRVVGLLGVSAVVIGFCLVIIKIARTYSFEWLIQRQLWALGLALVVYAVLPVDWLVHSYNARQVLTGKLAPSVQMIAHATRADGMLQILRLIDCEDSEIREGVRALAAEWSYDLDQGIPTGRRWKPNQLSGQVRQSTQHIKNWSNFQLSETWLREKLDAHSSKYALYADEGNRKQQLKRFYEYAYQWY